MAWHIEGSRGLLKTEAMTGVFDLSNPAGGLHNLEALGHAFSARRFLAVRVPDRPENDPPVEAYVRGDDLVVKYAPRNSDLVSHHIYYRALSKPQGIELVLSAQTNILHSDPRMEVFSSFGHGELHAKSANEQQCTRVLDSVDYDPTELPQFFLVRPQDADISLVLFVHPKDFYRVIVCQAPDPGVSFWVFPQALEKGVIRRALFQLIAVPRDGDDLAASLLLEQATTADPPLAT